MRYIEIILSSVLLWGCDSLIEDPRIGAVSLEIVSPVPGAEVLKPGRSVPIEFRISGCSAVRTYTMRIGQKSFDVSPVPMDGMGRYRVDVSTLELLDDSGWPEPISGSAFASIELQVAAVCEDHGQSSTAMLGFSLAAVDEIDPFNSDVLLLADGPRPGSLIAAEADEITGYTHDRSWFTGAGARAVDLIRIIEPNLYVYSPCRDLICFNTSGTLFRLDPQTLAVYFGGGGLGNLLGTPVDLIASPDPGQILVPLLDLGTSLIPPKLLVLNDDLSVVRTTTLPLVPSAPLRTRGPSEVVLIGLPAETTPTQPAILAVGPGAKVTERPIAVGIDRQSALTTISSDGERAAIFDESLRALHRIRSADGSLVGSASVDASKDERWSMLAFSSTGTLVLGSDRSVRVVSWETGSQLATIAPQGGVQGAALAADGCVAVLDHTLDLQIFDARGNLLSEQGPLPSRLHATSNLLASSNGTFHYGAGPFVMTYRFTPGSMKPAR
jgi:hypothetical protein